MVAVLGLAAMAALIVWRRRQPREADGIEGDDGVVAASRSFSMTSWPRSARTATTIWAQAANSTRLRPARLAR